MRSCRQCVSTPEQRAATRARIDIARIDPLSKFPVGMDLAVDSSIPCDAQLCTNQLLEQAYMYVYTYDCSFHVLLQQFHSVAQESSRRQDLVSRSHML